MFKYVTLFAAILALASAKPGHLLGATHTTIVQPAVLTKTAVVDHSASSAITHQSFTNLVRKVPVVPAVPVVKTIVPAAVPVVKTYEPLVHTTYAVQQPIVYSSAPVLKTVVSPAVTTYALHH